MTKPKSKAEQIRDTSKTGKPVNIPLRTSQKILARITDGIYRQPASALRELISNAYDADARKVTITTDAPRFAEISVRDDGIGISPEMLQYLIENIGGSAKRTGRGEELRITSSADKDFSPKGRKLIGKMGIGLFAVAQFTRHFLIITKCKGEGFRTIADVTLGKSDDTEQTSSDVEITSGEARIWIESASNINAQGTEVKLLDLLPRTRAELCSLEHWSRIDFESEEDGKSQAVPPVFHIGRMDPENADQLLEQPKLPWDTKDGPKMRFEKLVTSVRALAGTAGGLVDLDAVCDNYLQTLWNLALACPLDYMGHHPFDIPKDNKTLFFDLENKTRGQSVELKIAKGKTAREELDLQSPWAPKKDKFELLIDGTQISRPIVFIDQPKTVNAIKTPLLFVGKCREEFDDKLPSLSGGPLEFEAYLFWTPKVLPTQHQGVMLRVGNAAGAIFDRTFMGYQISEQTRLRQITAEIFVHEGLDGAINLDRETYNFAHPHYQFLVKWLHSALRQLSNRNKAIGKEIRDKKRGDESTKVRKRIERVVTKKLADVGVDDVVEVQFIEPTLFESVSDIRDEGIVAFRKDAVFRDNSGRKTGASKQREEVYEQKATALAQLLYGWGLLDDLSYDDQATLVRDILEIVLLEDGT
ncbi:MAG: ATP-binding protein [Planctomycetes bacterium]|nr:ATP-binding protein [Planctomycetota bacterium]